jgi:hypothetical protein
MKQKITFTKKDLIVALACAVFLLANIAAVGPRGRRHAKDMLCLSNMYKWAGISLAFAADNDGYFMPGWHPEAQNGDIWMDAVRPYYGSKRKLCCCPEATVTGTELGLGEFGGNGTFTAWGVFAGDDCGQPSPVWSPVSACDYGSYGFNGFCQNPPPKVTNIFGWPTTWSWRSANVAGQANIPLFSGSQWIDAWPHHTDPPPDYEGMSWGIDSFNSMYRVCINRHEGSINSAFLDASARKVPLKCLWELKWSRAFDPDQGPTEEEFNSAGNGWMAELPPCQ